MDREQVVKVAQSIAKTIGQDSSIRFKGKFLQAKTYEDSTIRIRASMQCEILYVERKRDSPMPNNLIIECNGCGGILKYTDDPQLVRYLQSVYNSMNKLSKNEQGFNIRKKV